VKTNMCVYCKVVRKKNCPKKIVISASLHFTVSDSVAAFNS